MQKARLAAFLLPPVPRSIASVQVFFSDLYTHSSARTALLQQQAFSLTCLDEKNCGNGPALLSFHYAASLPFLVLAQSSSTPSFNLVLTNEQGQFSPSNSLDSAAFSSQVSSFVTPKSFSSTESNFPAESGFPEVTKQGLLLSLHLSSGQNIPASSLSSFLQSEKVLTHPETDLQKNWQDGVIKYYETPSNQAAAKQSFQLAAQENPQFQAPDDFLESLPGSNANGNGGKAPVTTPVSQFGPSQIFSDLPVWLVSTSSFGFVKLPNWFLIIIGLILFLVIFAIFSRMITSYRRRREYRIAELKAAIDASRIGALEASQPSAQLSQPANWSQQPTAVTPSQQGPVLPLHSSTVRTEALPKHELHCPRCLEIVPADANYCTHCSLMLSPSESGFHRRVKIDNAPQPITLPSPSLPTPPVIQTPPGTPKFVKSSEAEKGLALSEQKPVQAIQEKIAANPTPIVPPPAKVVRSQIGPPIRAKQERKEGGGEREGKRLGNYRLLHLLGTGAFADVYLGEHIFLKTQAAIKVLHKRLTQQELVRFVEESRTIASLRHPHIIRVLEFGLDGHEIDLEQSVLEVEGSIPYLVMDYAPGDTLRARHPKGTRLPMDTILPYITQIADALYYAHTNRLIHRDVKPENMLIGYHDQVLLSDFGISVVSHSEQSINTQDVAGTVPYMAPEQIRGKPRPASDQYALAVVLYEWLCGVRPFQGTSEWDIIEQHLYRSPVSPREKLASLSPAIEAIVLKALSKDPQDRFISIQAFANALEEAFHHQ